LILQLNILLTNFFCCNCLIFIYKEPDPPQQATRNYFDKTFIWKGF